MVKDGDYGDNGEVRMVIRIWKVKMNLINDVD